MTCAEARRRLPGPDAPPSEALQAHLDDCSPCRAEAESLGEVDRRLHRLGAYRGLGTPELLVRLDQHLEAQRAAALTPSRRLPYRRLLAVLLLLLALLLLRFLR